MHTGGKGWGGVGDGVDKSDQLMNKQCFEENKQVLENSIFHFLDIVRVNSFILSMNGGRKTQTLKN